MLASWPRVRRVSLQSQFRIDNKCDIKHNKPFLLRLKKRFIFLPESGRNEYYKLLRQLGMLSLIPMVLVSSPLAGFLLGKWLDHKFNTGQGIILFFVTLGFLAGARESYRIIHKVSRDKS